MKDPNHPRSTMPEDLDDFWNIESLLPKKKKAYSAKASVRPHIDATEIVLDEALTASNVVPDAPVPASNGGRIAASTQKQQPIEPELSYRPIHPLIRSVNIYPWRSDFRFYERFCQTAAELHKYHGSPCEPVPFFSYMPQYDQMNRAQLDWYLYWRDCVRAGEFRNTDYSYIFLYLFEIINLPDQIPPMRGQEMMCRLWQNYRKPYPLLNRYLSDWICDYSLIHQLPPPTELLRDALPLITEVSTFKEFYAAPTGNDVTQDAQIYLTFSTNYDYKKSKLYLAGPKQAEAMQTHIPGALSYVLRQLEQEQLSFSDSKMQKATLCRDSFIGALCSGRMKRRIEVEYCSFQRSHELRFLITDIIKYTENRLRSLFGMKSRLSVYALPDTIKSILNAYFASVFPARHQGHTEAAMRPEYEALYDLPVGELSLLHAQKIEQDSWRITQQLVDAFDPESKDELMVQNIIPEDLLPIDPPDSLSASSSDTEEAAGDWLPYLAFLIAVQKKDVTAQHAAARAMEKMTDAIVEDVNGLAVEYLGDILLEADDSGGYRVIEDYENEAEHIISHAKGELK